MGLASKLAAAGPPPGGAPGGYPGQQQKPGGAYPGQSQYQAYPGGGASQGQQSSYGQQPNQYPPQNQGYQQQQHSNYGAGQQQYGGAQQQYGAPPPQGGNPGQVQAYKQSLQQTIQEKRLQGFFPPNSPVLDQIAQRASQQVEQLCTRWRMPREIGGDICKLGLFDIWLYIDDSGSMQFEENGSRIDDLKLILERTTYAATLFDDDGINLRFMNSNPPANFIDHVKSDRQIEQLMPQIQFKGLTPMGSELKNKVVEPIINDARGGRLRKPALVIIVTDGQPAGEPTGAVAETIKYANNELSRMSQYGPGAISFQFAQVGNDLKAREFLGKLDADPVVGHLIDCTSNYENESAEMAKAHPPVDLTPELWLVKLLLGSIDSSYDRKDEKASHPQQQHPGGQYGAPPPQQGYPPQQGGYPPQQGGYPPQQGGYPPQQGGYPPQQGGYPPQQGGYPPQGGYGGAPPPPRY